MASEAPAHLGDSQNLPVPLKYDRKVWNTLHGTNLPEHTDRLTAGEAASINDYFDVDICVGAHGQALTTPDVPREAAATQEDYDAAIAVVNSLRPGDTLFVEGYGFRRRSLEPSQATEVGISEEGSPQISDDDLVAAMTQMAIQYTMGAYRLQQRLLSAWDYAEKQAALKGVRVVNADLDRFDTEHWAAITNKEPVGLVTGNNNERALLERMQAQRERAAANIVKDWALEHLPPEEEPASRAGRKPRLVILFGTYHKGGLVKAFTNLGINASVHEMQKSDEAGSLLAWSMP